MGVADEAGQPAGDAWGDEIRDERKAELEAELQAWEQEADHGKRRGPFDRQVLGDDEQVTFKLSGADVFWLVARTSTNEERSVATSTAKLARRYQEGEDILQVYGLDALHLEGADLSRTSLEGAFLVGAHLEGTNLVGAHLEGANLRQTMLPAANLARAHLEGADLTHAHLEGANLTHAHLDGATGLTNVVVTDHAGWFASTLRAIEGRRGFGAARLADVHWNGADLTVVDWSGLRRLGDESKQRCWRNRDESRRATRANVQLATRLRDAGLNNEADHFAYRAQVCLRALYFRQMLSDWRHPWRLPGDLLRWLFSWLLFILAGYGYRPLRTLFWYLAVIGTFAFAYFQATHGALTFGLPRSQVQPLAWYEALVLSVSSFHGRGFFQPVQSLGDPVAILAAIEAVFGLFIEVSFIATFTQRYFGK